MPITQSLFIAIACSISAVVVAQPPPVEAYGRLPAIDSAAISADGKRVALSVGFEYKAGEANQELTALRIVNLDSGAIEHTLPSPAGNTLRGVGWADDQRVFYFISAPANTRDLLPSTWPTFRGNRHEIFRTGVFTLETRTAVQLLRSAEFRTNLSLTGLYAPIEGDAGFVRMIAVGGAATMNAVPRLAVYRVNLANGVGSPFADGNAQTRGFMLDERGDVVARVDINDNSNRWQLYTYEGGKDRMILEDVSEMGMPLRLYGLLQDGRIAAVDPHEDGARDTLLAIDRKTGAKSALEKTGGGDGAPIGDPWTHRVVGLAWTDDLPKQMYFDDQLQTLYTAIQQYFGGGYAKLQSWSRDRSRALVFGERAGDAGAYYVYDRETKKLRVLGKLYPALGTAQSLGDRRAIKYSSRDGTPIPAYLTLPGGTEPRNLPLVLLVHGGPHARDDFTFNWWASFLASRGYAVLQPNYRGSIGYGYDWFNAGRGGWGDGVMQTDVEDGVAALAKSGYVDASRVCIMGGSYGGYAALAGATLTPERYACAVSINGLSDPERLLNDSRSGDRGKRGASAEWWGRSMGSDMDHLHKVSPIAQASHARAPILIMHGADDSVVPVEQSRSMSGKLRRDGKDVKYIELKGDDHWLSAASTRTQMLSEVEAFLAEHLGGKGGPDGKNTATPAEPK
ncbi:MAG: S9 family peptidase [Pseudomonadota bacterium]